MIKYVIEVKWGFIGNYTNSPDLMSIFDEAEMNKIKKMIDKSQVCRALGPKVDCGTRLNKNEEFDFFRSEETMFLLVSDFKGLYKKQRSIFEDFKDQFGIDYSDYIGRLIILDIHESVENIQSLDNYLKQSLKIKENNDFIILKDNKELVRGEIEPVLAHCPEHAYRTE